MVFYRAVMRTCLACAVAVLALHGARAAPATALAMRGEPALPPNFTAFPYVDADAPKGGTVSYAAEPVYDSLNPYIIIGEPAVGVSTLVVETLMMRSLDEPYTYYPWVAKTVETSPDRSWVEFVIDERARFSDGTPVTAEDVKFSMELLRDKGRPNARTSYGQIARVDIPSPRTIRFTFKDTSNRELPMIMAGLPVLPRHAIDRETFDRPSLKPIIGSGPYTIADVRPGMSITYRRNRNWWARDLPSTRGQFNFDEIRYVYFRDPSLMFEAFLTGTVDVWAERNAVRWARDFNIPAVREGRIIKQEIANGLPRPADAFVFNTRRSVFSDRRVREAITYLFDAEWINRALFDDLYRRTCGFFDNSELSACGRSADVREKALLAPFPDAVTPEVMAGTWRPPVLDPTGWDRQASRKAIALLAEAGWTLRNGVMRNEAGEPLRFEISLLPDRTIERMAIALADSAQRIGIKIDVRMLDAAQAQRRRQNFDFDMIRWQWQSSLSPGSEQRFRWSSRAAQSDGSFNFPGVASPATDAMIATLLQAEAPEDFVAAVRAFDRTLISGQYIIPLFHVPKLWIARWKRTVRPDKPAMTVGAYGDLLASDPILAHIQVR